jgi:hypothetical protein
MFLSASLIPGGLRQIQKQVQKIQILVMMGHKFHTDDENTLELQF